jgi:hypothetical protein
MLGQVLRRTEVEPRVKFVNDHPILFQSVRPDAIGVEQCEKKHAPPTWISAMIMAIIPAHIMRSVGGGYDNESIAMKATDQKERGSQ